MLYIPFDDLVRTLEAALGDAGCYAETLCGYQARLTTAR